MELEEVIQARRSIRKFLAHEVDAEKTERLLECARLCQSAKNRQPWKFMILKQQDKDRVADIMLARFEQNQSETAGYQDSSKYSAQVIKQAPLLMLVFMERDENWLTSDLLSVGAAIEHVCLEAVNLGLGALWIRDTAYSEDQICKAVGYENLRLASAIAVGYAAESPAQRPRKAMEDIVIAQR